MTSNVVALRPTASLAERLWNAAPSLMRSRSGRTEVEKAVRAIKGEISPDALFAAFERYLAECPDYKRFRMGTNAAGPPGLHRWIRGRRWEAWQPSAPGSEAGAPQGVVLEQPNNPIRTALVQALGEGFVRSYIDPFPIVDGVLIVPEGKLTARAKLLENRHRLRAAGLVSMRKPDA
jgi:hypothetical protein